MTQQQTDLDLLKSQIDSTWIMFNKFTEYIVSDNFNQSSLLSSGNLIISILQFIGKSCQDYDNRNRQSILNEAWRYIQPKISLMDTNQKEILNNWLLYIKIAFTSPKSLHEIVLKIPKAANASTSTIQNNLNDDYQHIRNQIDQLNNMNSNNMDDIKQEYIWEWQENDGDWIQYLNAASSNIEILQLNESYIYIVNNQKYSIIKKTINSGIQTNIISNVSRKIRRINLSVKHYKWQWRDNDGYWNLYDKQISNSIEKLKNNQSYIYTYYWNKQQYKITKISCETCKQINLTTNIKRDVRRVVSIPLHQIKYPKWWNMKRIEHYAEPILTSLDLDVNIYAIEVKKRFYETVSNYTITKIESIQNQMLYEDYYGSKQKLLKLKNGDKYKLHERDLFHGTGNEDTMKCIQTEGFRKEFSTTAIWGEGTYFARDAQYSVGYSSKTNNIYKMFECKVFCGESVIGKSSYKLRTWPKQGNGLMVDSLKSNSDNIYVIHDNSRIYPMFVIHFVHN